VRVVIADDAAVIRDGIARLLSDEGIEVVGRAGDGDTLLDLVERRRPDVAIVDIKMPRLRPTRDSSPRTESASAIRASACSSSRSTSSLCTR